MFSELKIDYSRSISTQIQKYIKEMILKRIIAGGEKLPSTRELMSILNVSRNSIISAYENLKDEGLIYSIKGKGTFVSKVKTNCAHDEDIKWNEMINDFAQKAEELDIMKHHENSPKASISFKSIAPDGSLFDVEEFKKDFLNVISRESDKILNYGYAKGYRHFIEYLMEYMKGKGAITHNKDILITNGFTEAFDILLSSLTKPGDKIVCENPTHNTAIKLMKLYGLDIDGIDMESDGIDVVKLENEVKKYKFKLAYFIPSYHNPTGIVMSPQKRLAVLNILGRYGIPIIEDGFNEELRYSGAHAAPLAALSGEGNNVIYAGSFSKILFPGIRIGWVFSDSKLINYLESVKRSRNIHTSFLDQAVLYEYLAEGNFDKYMNRIRQIYKKRYEFALKCAKKFIPCKKILGEGGSHLFIETNNIDSRKLLENCSKKGVSFMEGHIFYTDEKGKNSFRIGITKVTEKDIETGFKIIGEEIQKLEVI